jgi:cytochrome c-type biogenesis protein
MSDNVSFGAAFVGGLLSFVSPCVLPLMPGYLSYISGLSFEELERLPPGAHLGRTLRHAAIFAAGFTAVFVALGLTATSLGGFLGSHAGLLRRLAGVLIFVFGLQVAGILRLGFLYRERRFEVRHHAVGPVRSLLLGMAFAFGWTPCVGPILFSVLSYAAGAGSAAAGGLLLLSYSLGLAIPFLLAAAATSWSFRLIGRSGRWLGPVQIAAGVVMMAMGLALVTGVFEHVNTFLARLFA